MFWDITPYRLVNSYWRRRSKLPAFSKLPFFFDSYSEHGSPCLRRNIGERFEILTEVLMKFQVFKSYRLYYLEDGRTTLLRNSTSPNIPEYLYIFISITVRTSYLAVWLHTYPLFFHTYSNACWTVSILLCISFTPVMSNLLATGAKSIEKNVCGPHKYGETRLKRHRCTRLLVSRVRYSLVPINFSVLTTTMYYSEQHSLITAQNVRPFSRRYNRSTVLMI